MRKTNDRPKRTALLALITAGILLTAAQAAASNTTPYRSRDDFAAVAGPTRIVEFSTDDAGDPLSDPPAQVGYPFLELSGACFRDVGSYYNLYITAFPMATVQVDLPPETYAVGTDLTWFFPIPGTFTVTLSTGDEYEFAKDPQIHWEFFGVVSDSPIQWVRVTYDNTYFALDNFTIPQTVGSVRGCPPRPLVPVDIDIKPGSDPNCININGHGVIPTAILGSTDLDVNDIRVDSLSLDGLAVRVRGQKGPLCSIDFSDADSFADLVCHFEDDPSAWVEGTATATLTGELLDGTLIEGTDSICIVP